MPALRKRGESALGVCPAATMPGSLTTSARRAPSSPANSPSASTLSGPKTIRVRGWKSKGIMRSAECGVRSSSTDAQSKRLVLARALTSASRHIRTRSNSYASQLLFRQLVRPGAEQEIDDVPFVRLQPVELGRGDRADVQAVDVRGVGQLRLTLRVRR